MSSGQTLTGTYTLLLHLNTIEDITVGKLGTFRFLPGWYTYIGSAMGPGGLTARLKHHLQPTDNPHWHIDYLRQVATLKEIWLSPDTERREEDWVDLMLDIPGATILVEGFGASDTQQETHLFYFDVYPSLEDFAVGVRARFPHTKVLRAFGDEK